MKCTQRKIGVRLSAPASHSNAGWAAARGSNCQLGGLSKAICLVFSASHPAKRRGASSAAAQLYGNTTESPSRQGLTFVSVAPKLKYAPRPFLVAPAHGLVPT